MTDRLTAMIAAALEQPVPEEAQTMARELAAEGGNSVLAVLFYGSCLRERQLDGRLRRDPVCPRRSRTNHSGGDWWRACRAANLFFRPFRDGQPGKSGARRP